MCGNTTPPINSELIFTWENIHFKFFTLGNCMYARVHSLSPMPTQESSQADNGHIRISKFIYSLNSRDKRTWLYFNSLMLLHGMNVFQVYFCMYVIFIWLMSSFASHSLWFGLFRFRFVFIISLLILWFRCLLLFVTNMLGLQRNKCIKEYAAFMPEQTKYVSLYTTQISFIPVINGWRIAILFLLSRTPPPPIFVIWM